MYQYVIFDLDGTLLNTLDDLADAGNWVCEQNSWPTHSLDAYKQFVGNGIPKLVERFTPISHRDTDTLAALTTVFSARYEAHKEDKTAPYEGMVPLVERLHTAGVHMAVLTNKSHHLATKVVGRYYPNLIVLVQGALPNMPTKPDPTLLMQLMQEMGATRENTLFVGDSNVDIQTAKNGGLTSCGVLWGFRSQEELEGEGADYLATTPHELEKIILKTN